eukprot:TRINITY_DN918_c0_g2_i2.p1 TRINITY_DN918_c0_g2~~TRINITY_DN918_c0_g2_i2.p1  ORF type:complete len:349 (-),score=14.87 TRINITY_DN918_c0_g2_i2:218-1264(-)
MEIGTVISALWERLRILYARHLKYSGLNRVLLLIAGSGVLALFLKVYRTWRRYRIEQSQKQISQSNETLTPIGVEAQSVASLSSPHVHCVAYGGSGLLKHPNTLSSFRLACKLGVDCVQVDCWPTKDEHLVAHYLPANSKSSALDEGLVWIPDLNLREVRGLKLPNGAMILTLRQVFEEIKFKHIHCAILVKNLDWESVKWRNTIVHPVEEHKMRDRVTICLDLADIQYIDVFGKFSTFSQIGLWISRREDFMHESLESIIQMAQHYQISKIYVDVAALTAAAVQFAHDHNVRVVALMPRGIDNSDELLESCLQLGVDEVCTNRPDRLRTFLAQKEQEVEKAEKAEKS